MIRLLRYDFVGFLRASRIPNLLIIGATQYLSAIFLVGDYAHKYEQIASMGFFLMVASTVMIAAGGYIINDYYDQKIDMINRPERVVVGTLFRRRLAMLAHFVLSVSGIALGFFLDVRVGAIHVLSVFSLWYYSNFLRRLPLLGNLIIAFLTGLTLLVVAVYLKNNAILIYVYAAFAMAIVLIREVIKDIEDVKGDAAFGCQSIPVIFGVRGAKFFIYLVCLGSAGLLVSYLVAVQNWWVRYFFIALGPVFLWFIYRLIKADRQRDYAWLIRFTNVIIFSGLVSMILTKL
ncbi:geranylgeranylglycerol-phosphate geranylgeranyltransferase [Marinoscillum furvescens]|uniref:4-hydroxybenzoate polyprenyltransferase n=1 Tax=Marinoscillum furvescens DSM 4134 TaxID=1122208 RepID=A0A3D9L742_MARFU|nr:geranylgeranylglycerol-phosphate geranylgeranyltransferase [Marinoscillum furvescens]REE01701.1 4-hydroxybenzoate polyprenyltransferase [Marinoscillum furvescens DSM 4134]